MRFWSPCPVCGKMPWRPAHAANAHGAGAESLDELKEWADEQAAP